MKKAFLHIYILAALLSFAGCHEDDYQQESLVGSESWITLAFGSNTSEAIDITTRATLDVIPESRVQNMFIYIFANDGKRLYSHYFDNDNLTANEENLANAKRNCWYVKNMTSSSEQTQGVVRMRTSDVANANIYIVANIDADMVNISPEKLNIIQTEDEIINLTATLNQEITSRNGYFPMAAKLEGIDISNNSVNKNGTQVTAHLERLDAKVEVNVRVAKGNKTTETKTEYGKEVTTTQVLKDFVPESWRIVNLPKGAYVMPDMDSDYKEVGFFNTEEVGFESAEETTFTYTNANGNSVKTTSKSHGFSFYMLQNRNQAKKTTNGNYHLRDMRNKNANGEYDNTNGLWEYAPEYATYLEIKGQVLMDVDVSSEAKSQHLAADVVYYVHLGDFATSTDNYDIIRNTSYTYTITIKGVSNIKVEVETSQPGNELKENEAGATGNVYIANEEIITFDAHYSQRVYSLDADAIDPENVTWYVKTPFSEGVPKIIGETEIPSGLDYKWVEFMINKVDAGNTYSKNNQAYPGTGSESLMDILEFTKFIKEEVTKHKAGQTSAFKKEFDQDWFNWYKDNNPGTTVQPDDDGIWHRYRLYVTVFVDEFYYKADPITGATREGLWKEFVNQPNRLMHILCDNKESLDKESSSTGSVITIRQRSIQTPYNINKAALTNGWGGESVDEMEGYGMFFYSPDETHSTGDFSVYNPVTKNSSSFNGLYNTAILWGVLSNSDNPTMQDARWDKFLEYERPNNYTNEDGVTTHFLRDDYAVLRYASLLRNRDNNGNGLIDADEMRWYIASIDQLYGMYFGELGLASDAVLYPVENAAATEPFPSGHPYEGAHVWRKHIISSTSTGGHPVTLWAEEGISVSNYGTRHNKPAPYAIRCIRNLGIDHATEEEAIAALRNKDKYPTPLVRVIAPEGTITTNSVYKFDLSNINTKSLRFYTTRELEPGNEHSEMSRPFQGFITGDITTTGLYADNNAGLYYDLIAGFSPCKEYWRVPNVREAAMMSLYSDSEWWDGYITVSSFYSNGKSPWGNNNDNASPSWQFYYRYATIAQGGVTKTRAVQDWYPDE